MSWDLTHGLQQALEVDSFLTILVRSLIPPFLHELGSCLTQLVNAQFNFCEVQAQPRTIPHLRTLRFRVSRTAIATSFAFPFLTSGYTDTKQEVEDYQYELRLLTDALNYLLRCARRVGCSQEQCDFILSMIHRLERIMEGGEGSGLDRLTIFSGWPCHLSAGPTGSSATHSMCRAGVLQRRSP